VACPPATETYVVFPVVVVIFVVASDGLPAALACKVPDCTASQTPSRSVIELPSQRVDVRLWQVHERIRATADVVNAVSSHDLQHQAVLV
jgi:hypothetical protein